MPGEVRLIEVGPRDGFQMESRFIPTELKIEVIEALADAGLREIEAVSFVHPEVVPQMRDATEVMAGLRRRAGVRYWALVPNLRGAERALASEIGGIHLVICVSESYNQRNVGMSVGESFDQLEAIVREVGDTVPVAVTLAATFGCPIEGQLPAEHIVALASRVVDAGATELGLADSAGLGHPVLIRRIVRSVGARLPDTALRMHLHDTRGLGIANAVAALEEGVASFDTALGGLGGCPVVRGASGNIATEDFVHLCHESGIDTGLSLAGVRASSSKLESFLERPLPSRVLHAGTREELLERNREWLVVPEES